jgi:3-methyladenine DNA glycosylase AlkD
LKTKKPSIRKSAVKTKPAGKPVDAAGVVAWLKRTGTKRERDGMARFGLPSDKAFGVSVGTMQRYAKEIGQNHELSLALWETGWYEARMMAAFVGEPERVTPAQMDRWCADFDNWGIVDTVCFKLFDRTPHAWAKVDQWSRRDEEFAKRGGFALLACLALHDKAAGDDQFIKRLPLIERASTDDRNFVIKGVSWAFRLIGRRSPALNEVTVTLSRQLAASPSKSARWLGRGALKELTSPAVIRKLGVKHSR